MADWLFLGEESEGGAAYWHTAAAPAMRKRHAHTPTQSIYVLGDVSPCAHTMLNLGIDAYWGEWIDANARMMKTWVW